ncbi:MAG: LamG domain-containing protein, partial [Planctomycetota bacterium]|nr:LamG domain-containing protein [Planctomycetota bacterium]
MANPDRIYPGSMDDVGIFNQALSAAEVMSITTSGVSGYAGSNLVAHWDFNQSSGNVAIDNTQGIELYLTTDGIVPFGPVYQAGQGHFGGAFEFDGADDLATFQDPNFDVGERGTLSFWVNFDNTGAANQFFEGPGNAGFEFQYRTKGSGQIYGRATTVGGDFVIRSGGDAATLNSGDGWHNIQYTWDFATSQMKIYLDGAESTYLNNFKPTDLKWAAVVDTANGIMHMGYDPGSAGQFFDGMMDDVAWYNDVLTSTELDDVRISGASTHPDLVANWKFDSAPTVDNTYLGDSGTSIVLYLQQLPPEPPVSGYGVVTPAAAVVLNNVFFNNMVGSSVDSNHSLDASNITGATANPFFNGDQSGYSGTTLEEFYTLRFGSSAAFQSTEFEASIATAIPHIGAYQDAPVAVGIEDMLIVGTDQDDLLVITFTSESAGSFVLTTGVGSPGEFTLGPVAFSNITSITFDSYGGDDVMQIIQPSSGFFTVSGGIFFNAGSDLSDGIGNDAVTGVDGDTLILSPAGTMPAIADIVEYVFENAVITGHVGSIIITDASINAGVGGSTTIFYDGLEPRIFDSLNVDRRIFTYRSTAPTETITLQSSGDTLGANGFQNKIGSSTGVTPLSESVSFNNPNTSLTINAGDGDQTINVDSLHSDFRAAIAINGDGGNDIVTFSTTLGSLILGAGSVTGILSVTADTINIHSGVSLDTTGGDTDGDVTLTAVAAITMNDSSTLAAGLANIIMTADGNVNLSRILSADTVTVTSFSAGIIDNRTTDELANITANTAILSAATGIGAIEDLDTSVAQFTLVNSTAGNIDIENAIAATY